MTALRLPNSTSSARVGDNSSKTGRDSNRMWAEEPKGLDSRVCGILSHSFPYLKAPKPLFHIHTAVTKVG